MNSQQATGDGRSNQGSRRDRGVQASDCATAIASRKPVGEINNHSWEKTGLCQSQKKAGQIKLACGVNETSENGNHTPGDHDSRNPLARTPALDDDRARDLKQDIRQV